jgi:hypothetical protein
MRNHQILPCSISETRVWETAIARAHYRTAFMIALLIQATAAGW